MFLISFADNPMDDFTSPIAARVQETAPGAATSIRRCLGEACNEVFRKFTALWHFVAYIRHILSYKHVRFEFTK